MGQNKGRDAKGGAQGRDKKRQNPIVPKAISTRAASNKANLVMAAKMCKDPVQMSMRGCQYRFPGPLPPVVVAEGRRFLPEEDAARRLVLAGYGLSGGLVLYFCLRKCASRLGSAGTDAAGYAVAWSALGFIGEGLHRNTYIGSYVAGPERGRRCHRGSA